MTGDLFPALLGAALDAKRLEMALVEAYGASIGQEPFPRGVVASLDKARASVADASKAIRAAIDASVGRPSTVISIARRRSLPPSRGGA